jgi:hypothetical protein
MRVLLFTVLVPLITAFSPAINTKDHRGISTELHDMNRRKAFTAVASATAFTTGLVLGFPESSKAFSQQLDDHLVEPTQLPTDGKLDLNSAYVVSSIIKSYSLISQHASFGTMKHLMSPCLSFATSGRLYGTKGNVSKICWEDSITWAVHSRQRYLQN